MGYEIERKFLVSHDGWRLMADTGIRYRQGYLSLDPERSVRIRLAEQHAWLNIKSKISSIARHEFEYPIPVTDADELLRLCIKSLIEKTRYCLEHGGLTWEIDEFSGANSGLIVAEVELKSEDEAIDPPDWLGEEVSDDPRYRNINLVRHPYSLW